MTYKIYKITIMFFILMNFTNILAAKEIYVAVSSNFSPTFESLMKVYHKKSNDKIIPIYASSGTLATQIKNGLKVDLFLSADINKVLDLEMAGYGIKRSRFTYAEGELIYVGQNFKCNLKSNLEKDKRYKVAYANPSFAPYGEAALSFLKKYKIDNLENIEYVVGNSVLQVRNWGNLKLVDYAIIPKALYNDQLKKNGLVKCNIDQGDYSPIIQQAIKIKSKMKKQDNRKSVERFYSFLKYDKSANSLILDSGYKRPKR